MEYLGIDFSCALGSLRDGKIPEKECLLPLISKLLGYCIVAASTTVKLPQARISTYIIQILVYFSFNLNNLVFEFSYLIANLGFDLISAWDLGIVIVTFKINHRECLGLEQRNTWYQFLSIVWPTTHFMVLKLAQLVKSYVVES